ncbi:hypothetical protein [Seonamhaeicola sp.]
MDQLGVQEMNVKEMREENGGVAVGLVILIAAGLLLICQDAN